MQKNDLSIEIEGDKLDSLRIYLENYSLHFSVNFDRNSNPRFTNPRSF